MSSLPLRPDVSLRMRWIDIVRKEGEVPVSSPPVVVVAFDCSRDNDDDDDDDDMIGCRVSGSSSSS